MEKRLKNYLLYFDGVLTGLSELSPEEKKALKQEHLTQIAFFQHERLIHLIVTVTFALLEIISLGVTVLSTNPAFIALSVALLVLLIPYIRHYYILENGVQRMYSQYDQIK